MALASTDGKWCCELIYDCPNGPVLLEIASYKEQQHLIQVHIIRVHTLSCFAYSHLIRAHTTTNAYTSAPLQHQDNFRSTVLRFRNMVCRNTKQKNDFTKFPFDSSPFLRHQNDSCSTVLRFRNTDVRKTKQNNDSNVKMCDSSTFSLL